MADPPAAVVKTLKPQGNLQLHRLTKRASFHCVHCRKDKKAHLVATKDGDWARTVCHPCYRVLLGEQRESGSVAKEEVRRASRPKSPSRKAARGAQQEREAWAARDRAARSRWPGAYNLVAFLRAADVSAKLDRDGRLWINGKRVQHGDQLPQPETFQWRKKVDTIVVDHIRDKFNTAVDDYARLGKGLRIIPQWRERGFSVVDGDVQLAIIHPTRAYVSDGKHVHAKVIHANFLTPGPHWQQVANALHRAELELTARWKHGNQAHAAPQKGAAAAEAQIRHTAEPRRINRFPTNLSQELISACLDASHRIRLERQVAYERPLILQCDVGELTLLPIVGSETRLRMPFRLVKGTETLQGELLLGNRDPLPLLISEDVAHKDAITAWTHALLGFADATCIKFEPTQPTALRVSARPRRGPSSAVSHRRHSMGTLPRTRHWPRHLEPVGQWISYSGSLVAGHRRHLNGGRTASDEARERARQVGIILQPDETWVQPHVRGIPDNIEMRFLWHAPVELKLFHQMVEALSKLGFAGRGTASLPRTPNPPQDCYGSCRSLWSWWRVRIDMPAFVGLLGLVLVAASPQGPGLAVRLIAPRRGDDGVTQLSQQLRQGDRDQSERGEVTVTGALPRGGDGEECAGEQAEGCPAVPGGPAGDLAAVQRGGLFGQLVIFLDFPAGDGHCDQPVEEQLAIHGQPKIRPDQSYCKHSARPSWSSPAERAARLAGSAIPSLTCARTTRSPPGLREPLAGAHPLPDLVRRRAR
jgi:hypothetical protein